MRIVVTFWLLALSIMDIRRRRVSVWILAAGGAGIGLTLLYQCSDSARNYMELLAGGLPGVLLLGTGLATGKVGSGDGTVLLLLGMLLGMKRSLLLFGISLFLISISSIILLTLRKAGRNTKIPYIPFLTAAWLLVILL